MSFDRSASPKSDPAQNARDFASLWTAMAAEAAHIAHAKRTLFLAYVAEGFNEAQALDLAKTL